MTSPTCKDCRFFGDDGCPYPDALEEDETCGIFEDNSDPDHAYDAAKEDQL